jgi:hypothetical protein
MKKYLFYLLLMPIIYLLNSCQPTCNGTVSLGLAVLVKDKTTGDTLKAQSQAIVFKAVSTVGTSTAKQIGGLRSPFESYTWIQFSELKTTGNYTFEVFVNGISKGNFDMTLGRSDNCDDAVSNIESMSNKGNTNLEFTKKFVGIVNAEWLLIFKN